MPSGYTAPVQSGEITELPDFAMTCARAFGALIEMRDDPVGAKIPAGFPVDPHYYESVRQATENVQKWEAISPHTAVTLRAAEIREKQVQDDKRAKEKSLQRGRYEAMLVKVEAWTPPTTEHQGLKDYMCKQLRDSIEWDCTDYLERPKPALTADQWLAEKRAGAQSSLDYAKKSLAEAEERIRGRNQWVADLRKSLGLA